jgi:multiple sugar transport system ATP-binding protein
MISGLEAVTRGEIYLDGRNVTWRHPSDRDIAFVFQFFALYPHMTVQENIIFPLQAEGQSKEGIKSRLDEVVKLLQIGHLLRARPSSLSGGDQQRVALARALVRRPAAFLMDEPLGALDAEFRETMRAEIKRLHIAQNATTVYVTHDQIEAMAMGDRIIVMSKAEIQQVGTPAEIYYRPNNLFVARFIGSPGMNLIPGKYQDGVVHLAGGNDYPIPDNWRPSLVEGLSGEDVIVGFRPEAAVAGPEGKLTAELYADELHGAHSILHLSLNGRSNESIIHIRAGRGARHPIGTTIRFDLNPEMVRFFDPQTESALQLEVNHG